jgi:2-amino-4-hydroxy-6-hydroxymethyldihydropteridine diphosphokinase
MKCDATRVFIALGANLPGPDGRDARATCMAAAEALRGLPGLSFAGLSRLYETDPIPAGGPCYVNAVAELRGAADPVWLLHRLQAIEAQAGRVRSVANAPRTLDLDIIAIGDLVRERPDPILPHPRAHLRCFVLQPLADLAPDWVHPRLHRSIAELMAALPGQGVRRI